MDAGTNPAETPTALPVLLPGCKVQQEIDIFATHDVVDRLTTGVPLRVIG